MMEERWAGAITEIVGDGQTAQFRFRVHGQSMAPTLQPGDEVTIERSSVEALRSGDIVLLHAGDQPLLHRFLGIRHSDGQRWLLTGGDRKRHLDPLWPEGALWGRAMSIRRGDQSLPLPTGWSYAWRLRLRAALGVAAGRFRLLLSLILALLLLNAAAGWASVTLVSFDAEWVEEQVRITWETASEVDNIGFYVLRSDQEGGDYQRVTELIPAEGDLVGGFYNWIDSDVAPGQVYYYKLEDVSASGGSTFAGPISLLEAATSTFTPTPEPTATDTPLPSSTPTPTPTPSPTSTPTSSPTDTPSPTLSATSTVPPTATVPATPTAAPTATSTPPATSTSLPTAKPSATASHTPVQPSATRTPVPTPESSSTSGPAVTLTLSAPAASPTSTPQPSPTPLPSPTATELAVVMAAPSEGESGLAERSDSVQSPDSSEEDELARAKRRLTWSLIGIAGAIGGALLLIVLALLIFALYQWGFLRPG